MKRYRVRDVMSSRVVAVSPATTFREIVETLEEWSVSAVPVVDGRTRHVVGIVSHRDLLAAAMSKVLDFDPASRRAFLRSIEVAEVMAKDVHTVRPDTPLADAAEQMLERKIGCLPVVDRQGKLIGLVTEVDLLAVAYLDAESARP